MSTTITTFLATIERGERIDAALFADAVRWDATVPNWRYGVDGADALRDELARWFGAPGRFEDLRRTATPTGELVEYTLEIEDPTGPVTVHHAWVLDIDGDGRIADARVWCGGRWDAALMAEMAASGAS